MIISILCVIGTCVFCICRIKEKKDIDLSIEHDTPQGNIVRVEPKSGEGSDSEDMYIQSPKIDQTEGNVFTTPSAANTVKGEV